MSNELSEQELRASFLQQSRPTPMNCAEIESDPIHSFSRAIAREHGVTEAILLGYIGHKIEHSQQERDGRKWFYGPLDSIIKQYPYLARSTVNNALKRLAATNGPLQVANHNRHAYDRTSWYAWRNDDLRRQLQTQPLYFKVGDAEAYGVCEAILLANLRFWIAKHREKQPDYTWHPLSPFTLASVLPFSESTIKRALQHLTDEDTRALQVRRPSDGRQPSEYAFATPQAGSESSGPDWDVNRHVLNMGGPNCDLDRSKLDMEGPDRDMEGSNWNNDTHLKDNHFKDSILKSCLKDKSFQNACVTGSFNSPAGSNRNESQMSDAAINRFQENVGGTITANTSGSASLSSAPATLPAVSLPEGVKPPAPPVKDPSLQYLDDEVHAGLWDLCKSLMDLSDPEDERLMMVTAVMQTLKSLIQRTTPEVLYRLIRLPNQRECMQEIRRWTNGYFEQVYDRQYSKPAYPDNGRLRSEFVRYCLGILAMGIHTHRFESLRVYIGQTYAYQVGLEISKVIQPWLEEQQAQQRQQAMEHRRQQYVSPDAAKESVAGLSAAEKMQVFMQSLMNRNRIGRYDEYGHFIQQVVQTNAQTMFLVRQFFQLNPAFTVAHLNLVLDRCLELPTEYYDSDIDPLWHARNARNISLFMRNLHIVVGQVGMFDGLPPFVPLSPPEEPEATQEANP